MVPPSLVGLAIKAVYDNIDSFDEELLKTCIGPVRREMLEDMFRKAKDHYSKCHYGETNHNDKIWAILPCLIKSKFYTKIDISSLTFTGCKYCTWPNYRFQEFIRCLGTNTPNLKELKMIGSSNFENSLEEREVASIVQLKNLTILDIFRVQVSLSGILDISRRCEKLMKIRVIKSVRIDEEPSIPTLVRDDFAYVHIEALLSVGLVSLHMDTTEPNQNQDNSTKNYSITLRHQPRYIREFSLALPFAKKLQGIHIDCILLEDTEEMVEFPHLPVIEYARIDCNSKSAHALRCFLERNGETLQVLHLSGIHSEENMTFSEIFSFCPHLQCLELFDCYLSGNDAPVDAMQQLKRFEWSNFGKRYSLDVVAFSSILSAPLLEDLCIVLYKIDFSDNATVTARIQRREILQNLKEFYMPMMEYTFEIFGGDKYPTYLQGFNVLNTTIIHSIKIASGADYCTVI